MEFFTYILNNSLIEGVFTWAGRLWFLWVPLLLGFVFINLWETQKKLTFFKNMEWVLLEIKIPKEVFKSPKAIEAILNSLYTKSSDSPWYKGNLSPWYSLEIVGTNGGVYFFIRTPKNSRNFVESLIYAQYPSAEVIEAVDYTYSSNFEDLDEWSLWGAEFGLVKEDAYPIKTYVDFGLEGGAKEEQKIDPIVSFLEFLGSLKQGEQIWFQIDIRGAGKEWVDEGEKVVDKLLGRDKKPGDEDGKEKKLSKREQEVATIVEKSFSKYGFQTGIRIIYIAQRDIFNKANVGAIIGSMGQYNTVDLNGFKPIWKLDPEPFGFLMKEKREAIRKEIILDAYRKRCYFSVPYHRKPFVLNTEELATIYHYPGSVAETPSFERIGAKKSEPPSTLPI